MLLLALALIPSITFTVHPDHVLNTFRPEVALGAGIDGHESGLLEQTFRPRNLSAMREAGLKPLTLRLRTELAIEAWHWNAKGTWSDPAHRQGYFVGDANPETAAKPEPFSYGYRLPRRGDTIDQANNDGYSRLDDGDSGTYWKSNPYLDEHYTGVTGDRYPQWVLIDLEKPKRVDTIRIDWAEPYASQFRIEYWTGKDALFTNDDVGADWKPIAPNIKGRQGMQEVRFPSQTAEFVRIRLIKGSQTSIHPSSDVRDRLGFAIREIGLGTKDSYGFHDLIRKGKTRQSQSKMFVSSTDPWHRASDIDRNTEEPGFDRLVKTGLTSGLPLLVPAPVLYDNPENAANEIRWLERRGIPISGIEMGEEPDGQYATPEHYSQLYAEVAHRIRSFDSKTLLGGPCYQTADADVRAWPDSHGNRSWTNRFLSYLKGRADFQFFSFEWYPWDDTHQDPYPQLARTSALLDAFMKREAAEGVPKEIPWMMTEYGYSAFSGEPEVDLPSGILNADTVGTFLADGGHATYLYGYEPNELIAETPGAWGNLMQWQVDEDGNAKWKLPTFWVAWLMTHVWSLPSREAQMIAVEGGSKDVSGYTVLRADGRLAMLIVNRNPRVAATVRVRGADRGELWGYGPREFAWRSAGEHGKPVRSQSPEHLNVRAGLGFSIQPYSVNVLVWSVEGHPSRGRPAQ